MFLSGFSAIAAAIGIGRMSGSPEAPIPSYGNFRRHPSAANPRSKYHKAHQGRQEKERRKGRQSHIYATGRVDEGPFWIEGIFTGCKVTPRPAEAFHYLPDGQSRQVIRAQQRCREKARAHQQMLTDRASRKTAPKERKAARRKAD